MSTIKKVAFTCCPVLDMGRARQFYESVLGLTPESRVTECTHCPEGTWVEYDLPEGGCLALTSRSEAREPNPQGMSFALEVEDLDSLIAHLKEHSVRFLKKDVIETPVCRRAVIADSEGNAVLLHQLKRT